MLHSAKRLKMTGTYFKILKITEKKSIIIAAELVFMKFADINIKVELFKTVFLY